MKNDDDEVEAGSTIWHVAYHPFKYPEIPPYIWFPHWSDNGWVGYRKVAQIQQTNYQIIMVCGVILTQGH